ncbi:basic form of pathogenesis-related protein 1-like [Benincasa hispida]|uniref:basic form of pathogenesis-related protein 1-like n=1 Tax=Benincasa hispida TaxID=102211 RepID=UPI0019000475|nr:basic form of pathogenesis-related protein 1-like [Benincasa hispida]
MWTQKPLMAIFLATFMFVLCQTHAQNSPRDYVALHNRARAQVRVGPVTWNKTIAAYAQAYANKRRNDCAMVYSGGPYGENIAAGYYPEITGAFAMKLWLEEKPLYNYTSNLCIKGECNHYTQVVWRNSVHIGCARVPCKSNSQFVICNYHPPGNIFGQRPYDSPL